MANCRYMEIFSLGKPDLYISDLYKEIIYLYYISSLFYFYILYKYNTLYFKPDLYIMWQTGCQHFVTHQVTPAIFVFTVLWCFPFNSRLQSTREFLKHFLLKAKTFYSTIPKWIDLGWKKLILRQFSLVN